MRSKNSLLFSIALIFSIVLTACQGQATQSPAAEPPAQGMPGATEAPQPEGQPEPEQPIELPAFDPAALELGSWMYWFDDSIVLFIPAGNFIMGDPRFEDNPARNVSLGGYWIYRNPVTQDMYRKCVVAGACDPPATEPPYDDSFDPERADHPVVGVDWEQAQTYCQWMDADLPTEAQWEKAARGPDGSTYPWGEEEPGCSLLNFKDCVGDTTPVQAYYPKGMSYYELFDTAGNTFEWTRDWYLEDYYKSSPEADPFGPSEGSFRAIRGSSFESDLDLLPLAHRLFLQPERYRVDLGFRCVITEPTNYAPFCVQTAYIPGENKGPSQPPAGGPEVILQQVPRCQADDPNFSVGRYCVDRPSQTGGAAVTYTGNLQSVTGVACDNGNPMGCWGPENASFEVVLCTQCSDWVPPNLENPSCDPGYTLVGSECVFQGIPAIPATNCPPGWWLDADGYCKPFLLQSDPDCPHGYQYDSTSQCCTATFIEPSGGWGGVPANSYSSCPVGYDYINPPGICVSQGYWVTGQQCQSFSAQLGECRDYPDKPGDDPGDTVCENPRNYSDQGSCEAAGCKWVDSAVAAPYCTFP